MGNFIKKLFGRKAKVQSAQDPQGVQGAGPTTFIAADPFESPEQLEAVKAHIRDVAARDPERHRMIMRMAAFEVAKHNLKSNFPNALVKDAGCFPGDPVLLGPNVKPEDTGFIIASDPSNPIKFLAVELVVNNDKYVVGGESPAGSSELKAAEQAVEGLLKQWHSDGMVDGFFVFVRIAAFATVHKFSGKDGLVEVPGGVEIVVKKETQPEPLKACSCHPIGGHPV